METTKMSPVQFTAEAAKEIRSLMNDEGFDRSKILRVGVKGGGCSGMSYMLGFDDREEQDDEYESDGIRFMMKKAHGIYLTGMQIDWSGGLDARGFMFTNPNASKTCGCGTSFAV